MKIIQTCTLAAAVAGLSASAPVAAQTPAATAPAATNPKAADNSNEVVCERQEITGSRLGTRRICKTRAEWADLKLQDRQEVEQAQTRRGMKGE